MVADGDLDLVSTSSTSASWNGNVWLEQVRMGEPVRFVDSEQMTVPRGPLGYCVIETHVLISSSS